MSPGGIAVVVVALAVLGYFVLGAIARDEQRKRAEWRPDGYRPGPADSKAVVSDWWASALPPIALAQNVRSIDAPPAAEMVSVADPRVIRTNRHLSAPATKRMPVERVRRVEKKRPRGARGAA